MQRSLVLGAGLGALLACGGPAGGTSRLLDGFESTEGWATGGQKEIRFNLSDRHVRQGRKALHLHVEIDHSQGERVGKVKYPMGWPSVRKRFTQSMDLSGYDFIEFDVYFESRRGVDPDFALHATFRDADDRTIYSTVLTDIRHGKWAHEKLCIRDIPAAASFRWVSFWLSESVYDDGDVIDFYIDNLRAVKAADYRPPPVRPVRRLLARSETGILWFEGPTRKVRRTDIVDFSTTAPDPVVRMWAARNETEAVQLVLRPTTRGGLGEATLDIGALTGPGGAGIAAANITWSPVGYVPDADGPTGGYPDALPAPGPFKVERQWNYPVWIEVYVPPGSAPGNYRAPVVVRTSHGVFRAELRLHVWDFDIPVRQSLRTSTTIYGPWGWRKDIKKWYGDLTYGQFMDQWRPKIVRMLARYRLSPSALSHLPMAYDKKQKRVVLRNTDRFVQTVQSYLDMGHRMDQMPVPYFFDRPSFLGAKKGTEAYLARIRQAYRLAAEFLDGRGWMDDCYVYCVDECVVHKHTTKRDFNLLNRVFETMHAAHPKIRIFGAETPSPLLRGVDIWCMNMNAFDPDVLAEQHALGNEVWWYNGYSDPRPGTRIDARGVDHRALFWMNWKYGIDGYLVWTVNRWLNNPWEQPRPAPKKPLGDHFLLYPNPDGTVSPSIRLAMLRDGLEDYEYHVLLSRLEGKLREAGRQKLAAECRAVLERADAFILAFDNCPHIRPNYIYDSRSMLGKQIEKARRALRN